MKSKKMNSKIVVLVFLFLIPITILYLGTAAYAQWTSTTFTGNLGNVEVFYADDSPFLAGYYDSACVQVDIENEQDWTMLLLHSG
jgi:hypothetical protein